MSGSSLITHIVSFRYSPSISQSEKHYIASSFLALKEVCLLPKNFYGADKAAIDVSGVEMAAADGKYIIECIGGINNSPEGMAAGYDHTFILTFRNLKERDYYLDHDPAHQAFKKLLGGKLDSDGVGKEGKGSPVWVFDFAAGVFE